MKNRFLIIAFSILALISCKDVGRTLPSATGARFEVLLVIEDSLWTREPGRVLFELFDQDTEALPQPEPIMRISHVRNSLFTNLLKPTRNVLYTEISSKYTRPKVVFSNDHYAFPQAYVRVVAPDEHSFLEAIKQQGEAIVNYFVVAERNRSILFNKKDMNLKAVKEIKELFNVNLDIPLDLRRSVKGEDFYWLTNDNSYIRQDLVVYSYPYTDHNTFTYEYLTAKRDSVMRKNVPGEFEDSYMGTEYKYAQPIMREIAQNGEYAVEIRGLWKIINGASMGGPYYSITRLDEVNQRVVTVEGFVFAPGAKKRNAIRLLEAVTHSLRLDQDLNVLAELSITAKQKDSKEEEKN